MYPRKSSIKPVRSNKRSEIPSISVPFPPEITVAEILKRRPDTKLGSRAPNRFFIYRLAYIKELKKRVDDNYSMTKISPHISLSWSKESSIVKEEYKKLSDKVEERLKEIRQNETLVLISENFPSQPRSPQKPPQPTTNIPIETNYENIPIDIYPCISYSSYDQPFYLSNPISPIEENNVAETSEFCQDMVNYEYFDWTYYDEFNTPCFWLTDDNSILADFILNETTLNLSQFDY
ncbi:hypothetical protein RclHR1_01720027 [Rhizophagus clarus]|uniref:Kinase-like domain-containing protein n=1 Tax=Rhizophagus clarus TaxID=94130 RepID=A0A2Z6RC82_9GLOM|nr:hypothetical protein RclHR1_01720027 [Rhizophagus clarus]GES99581.1 kinase-like domain-containing protein [Rhizophagus clarus]